MKTISLLLFIIFIGNSIYAQTGFVVNHQHTDLSQIPDNWLDSARVKLRIHYFRRSHGSQVDAGGMTALENYFGDKYDYSSHSSPSSLHLTTSTLSVDYDPNIWESETRDYLNDPANSEVNIIMWAWSYEFYTSDIQAYLNIMEDFISEYGSNGTEIQNGNRTVPVTFVFQTACSLGGDDENEIVFNGNNKIRKHCFDNDRALFDFNDIECYNPDGEYFGDANSDGSYSGLKRLNDDCSYNIDENTRGNWGNEWMEANPNHELSKLAADNVCESCAHSDGLDNRSLNSRLHCILKGRAAWWMWAVLAGWEEGIVTKVEKNTIEPKLKDLKNYPNPFNKTTTIEYNVNKNADVLLELWNSNGQKIKTLVDKKQTKGNYKVEIDLGIKKGVYFYTLKVDGTQKSNKMIKIN